jgi:hypothetical protein
MKTFARLLCTVLITHFLLSHTSYAMQDKSPLDVLKFKWRKLSETDPLARKPSQHSVDAQIDEQYRKNQPDWSQVNQLELEKLKAGPRESSALKKGYEYEVEVRNGSSKEVTSVIWAYVFTDPVTEKELVRHSFNSKANIKPGKQKKLVVQTDESEPKVINAQADRKKGGAWKEAAIIEKVEYSDGSKWERVGTGNDSGL